MTTLPAAVHRLVHSPLVSGRVLIGLLGAAAAMPLGCTSAQLPLTAPVSEAVRTSNAPAAEADVSILKLGIAAERKLPPGGRDEIPLKLEPGRYVRLSFDSQDLDLDVGLLGPGGEIIGKAAGAEGRLSLITGVGGEHRLAVSSFNPKGGGRYRVTLQELRQAQPDDEHRAAADAVLAAAGRLRVEDKKQEALEQAEEALCRWRKLQDRDGEFEALYAMAALQNDLQNQEESHLTYEEALRLALMSGNRANQARVWTALGSAMVETNPEAARLYFDAALPVWRDLEYSDRQEWILYYLGVMQYNLGRVDDAITLYQQALSLAGSGENAQLTSSIWNGLGGAHIARGESQEALDCYERALRLARGSGSEAAEAAILTGMGLLYRRRGEPQKALVNFQEALRINQSDPDLARYVGLVLDHIGYVYLDLGRTTEALEKYRLALDASRTGAGGLRPIANALLSIAQVYLTMGRNQEALEQFEEALKVSRGKDSSREAASLHGIGVARLKLRQVPEALKALEEALPLRQKTDRLGEASTRRELGKAYQAYGDLARAATSLHEALGIAQDVGASFVQASTHYDLARVERQRGNLQESLTQIEQAINILESVRSDLSDDRLRTSFFASRRPYYDFWIDLLMELERSEPELNYADRAFAASEKGRARSLLDLLIEGRLDLRRGISPELKRQEKDITARLSQIQRQLVDERSDRRKGRKVIMEVLEARLKEVDEERQRLELRIWAEYPSYAKVRYPSLLKREEAQALLGPDSALLEFSLGEERGYLFVVTNEGLQVHPLSLSREEIAAEVRKVRSGLTHPGSPPYSYYQAAYSLYRTLIGPAEDEIKGKKRLLVAPDGALYFLAFEALRTEPTTNVASYLLQKYAISYVPSASVLFSLSQPKPPALADAESPKLFLAYAPGYGSDLMKGSDQNSWENTERNGAQADSLPPLDGAKREVEEIASRYPHDDVKLYLQQEATEANVKNNELVHGAKRIHFAAHGILDQEKAEYSGLVLMRTPDAAEDGFLQVFEIFNLELNADLVVLSACQTGLGTEVAGEGLVGLTRAFLYAGTTSVVVSLWLVADSSASDLMPLFYKNLDQGGDKTEALRQAKLAMVEEGGKFARPYYWAPFVLVGKPY